MIYLDYAATAPLTATACEAMGDCFKPGTDALFGNANSVHSAGRTAFKALERARESVMRSIGAGRPDEVIFTSGATEADNAALRGIALARRDALSLEGKHIDHPAIIVSAIEHDAVLETCAALKREGFAITVLPVDAGGFVSPESLEKAISDETVLVSIMFANNEIGSIQSIEALAQTAHAHGVPFHTDAVQAFGKIPCSVSSLGVDAASFSAHKAGGPKGVGVLYLKSGTPFKPTMTGGGQERGFRSGTQNIAGAIGCAAAFEEAAARCDEENRRLMHLRDGLYRELGNMPEVKASVDVSPGSQSYLPNIVNVCVRGFESQTLILQLDLRGFCVSGGSACSSGSLAPSHVLTAISIPRNLAQGSLRISMGSDTTPEKLERFVSTFKEIIR